MGLSVTDRASGPRGDGAIANDCGKANLSKTAHFCNRPHKHPTNRKQHPDQLQKKLHLRASNTSTLDPGGPVP
jgi:hypothetical protein